MSNQNAAGRLRPEDAVYEPETAQGAAPAPFPVATGVLLAIIIAVFAAMMSAGHGDVSNTVAAAFGDKESDLIRAGQWQRLITPIFLHGNLVHLLTNGLSLYWFGSQIERIYGARRYLVIFLISGVVGNLFSFLLSPGPSLGASGALFGLIGAALVFPLRYRDLVPAPARASIMRQLVPITLLNVAFSFTPGIDKWAHFGGLIGGGLLALVLMPALLDNRKPNSTRETALTLLCALLLLLTAGAGLAQWRVVKASPPLKTIVYAPNGPDPWWSFQLSERWVKSSSGAGGGASGWITPDGAVLTVNVIPSPIDLKQQADQFSSQGALVKEQKVGGQPALIVSTRGSDVADIACYISVFNRTIVPSMECPVKVYGAAYQDYIKMLGSIRFNHPPSGTTE